MHGHLNVKLEHSYITTEVCEIKDTAAQMCYM